MIMINKENINKALETIKVSSDLDKKILDKTIYNISPNPLSLKKVLFNYFCIYFYNKYCFC